MTSLQVNVISMMQTNSYALVHRDQSIDAGSCDKEQRYCHHTLVHI